MASQPNPKTNLLQPLDAALVPATIELFAIRDHFKTGAGVKFATIWGEFQERFLGKIEKPMPEARLRKYKLLALAPDGPIIAELGGAGKVECSMTAAYALLKRQANGEEGFLQTNGYANIFYVKDEKGVLCAVRIGLAEDGWVVDAIAVEDPLAWNGKHQIFCPIPWDEGV